MPRFPLAFMGAINQPNVPRPILTQHTFILHFMGILAVPPVLRLLRHTYVIHVDSEACTGLQSVRSSRGSGRKNSNSSRMPLDFRFTPPASLGTQRVWLKMYNIILWSWLHLPSRDQKPGTTDPQEQEEAGEEEDIEGWAAVRGEGMERKGAGGHMESRSWRGRVAEAVETSPTPFRLTARMPPSLPVLDRARGPRERRAPRQPLQWEAQTWKVKCIGARLATSPLKARRNTKPMWTRTRPASTQTVTSKGPDRWWEGTTGWSMANIRARAFE